MDHNLRIFKNPSPTSLEQLIQTLLRFGSIKNYCTLFPHMSFYFFLFATFLLRSLMFYCYFPLIASPLTMIVMILDLLKTHAVIS
jgi:hypothetical protein